MSEAIDTLSEEERRLINGYLDEGQHDASATRDAVGVLLAASDALAAAAEPEHLRAKEAMYLSACARADTAEATLERVRAVIERPLRSKSWLRHEIRAALGSAPARAEKHGALPWRTGRKVGRTIYDGHDALIGLLDTAELATAVVDAVNSGPAPAQSDMQRNPNYWRDIATTQAATLERVRALRDSHAHQARGSVFSQGLVTYLDEALGPAPARACPVCDEMAKLQVSWSEQAATLERVHAWLLVPGRDDGAPMFEELRAALGPAPARAGLTHEQRWDDPAGFRGTAQAEPGPQLGWSEWASLKDAEARCAELEADRVAIDLHSADLIVQLARLRQRIDRAIALLCDAVNGYSASSTAGALEVLRG